MIRKKTEIEQIIFLMESVIDDLSIPKNIRKSVSEAKAKLQTDEEIIVRASGAVYALNEVGEDINMPIHARTQIWTILSALESIKEQ